MTDTASVPHIDHIFFTDLGDRVYFAGDSGLAGIRTRDLARTEKQNQTARADCRRRPDPEAVTVIGLPRFAATKYVTVVDRYSESISTQPSTCPMFHPRCAWILMGNTCWHDQKPAIPFALLPLERAD